MKLTLIAVALAALVMPLHAARDGGGRHRGGRNKEKAHHPQAAFHRKDKDGNGQLSEQEFAAGAKNEKRADRRFKKEDADSNGEISRKEFKAATGAGHEGKKKAGHHGRGKKKGRHARKARHHGKKQHE